MPKIDDCIADARRRTVCAVRGWPEEPWGKFRLDGGGPIWHPLADHCTDVAACVEALLAQPTIRQRLAHIGGLDDLDKVQIQRLACLAFLHDIGKANIGFQSKVFPERRLSAGHVKETLPLLTGPLVEAFAAAIGWHDLAIWADDDATMLALLVASISHHGEPLNLDDADHGLGATAWRPQFGLTPLDILTQLGRACRECFPLAFAPAATSRLPARPPFQHAFAGLVMLADWIGSNPDHFPYSETDPGGRIALAREQAAKAMRWLGIDVAEPRRRLGEANASFEDVFGFSANPMQAQFGAMPLDAAMHLVILESETGSGKTEAALWHFRRLFAAGQVDGLYFALPTRAAATQLHDRVTRAARRLFPHGERPPVVLAVPGYLRVDEHDGRFLPEFKVLWNDSPDAAERYRRWAAENPKRAMAGPIIVGTIDQALLSNLRVSHTHLRSSALLRHLLVVDELHASDPYMHALLRSVLDVHLGAGGYALLMSATLGGAIRRWYFGGTALSLDDAVRVPYPAITTPSRPSERVTSVSRAGRDKRVHLTLAPWIDDPNTVAQAAVEAARAGAKVLIIRNTVSDAVAVQHAVELAAGAEPSLLFRCAGVATLHHSRFAREDRKALDKAVEERLGKARAAGGTVVVGTQTLEQSLDIDADLLISDLCPADVLLQRLGRLHRHRRDDRAADFTMARCVVLTPPSRDLSILLRRHAHGLGSVYADLRVIEATWRELVDREHVEVPAINRVFVEHTTHPDRLDRLTQELGGAWPAHGLAIKGISIGQRNVAHLNAVRRDVAFGEREAAFADLDEVVRTRLGENDRLAAFAEPVAGPFRLVISAITIPHHLCQNVASNAEPCLSTAQDGMLLFDFGPARFRYDRLGLRPERGD